jgi:hypothetical protein
MSDEQQTGETGGTGGVNETGGTGVYNDDVEILILDHLTVFDDNTNEVFIQDVKNQQSLKLRRTISENFYDENDTICHIFYKYRVYFLGTICGTAFDNAFPPFHVEWNAKDDNQCHICYYDCNNLCKKTTCCGERMYHKDCIDDWFSVKPSCPFCRTPFQFKSTEVCIHQFTLYEKKVIPQQENQQNGDRERSDADQDHEQSDQDEDREQSEEDRERSDADQDEED